MSFVDTFTPLDAADRSTLTGLTRHGIGGAEGFLTNAFEPTRGAAVRLNDE